MKTLSLSTLLIALLLLGTALNASAQDRQTIHLKLEVQPYLQLSGEPLSLVQDEVNPALFSSEWTTVGYANWAFTGSVKFGPAEVSTSDVDVEYIVVIDVNGEEETIRKRGTSEGMLLNFNTNHIPHDGIILMRVSVEVLDQGTSIIALPQPAVTLFVK